MRSNRRAGRHAEAGRAGRAPGRRLACRFGRGRRACELEIYPPGYEGPETLEECRARNASIKPIEERRSAALNGACAIRARTLDGCRARIRTLQVIGSDKPDALKRDDDPDEDPGDRLAVALLRDLIAAGAA